LYGCIFYFRRSLSCCHLTWESQDDIYWEKVQLVRMLFSPSASRQYFLTGKSSILVKINIFSLVHFLETANQYCIGCVYLYFDTVGRSSGRASAPQKLPLAVPRGFPRKICGEPWVLTSEGWREAWRPSPVVQPGTFRCSTSKTRMGDPQEDLLVVHCFCTCRNGALLGLGGLLEVSTGTLLLYVYIEMVHCWDWEVSLR